VRSVEVPGYGTGASVGFRIGGQATMLGAASVAFAALNEKGRLIS